jgi:hypothetical protein
MFQCSCDAVVKNFLMEDVFKKGKTTQCWFINGFRKREYGLIITGNKLDLIA